MRAPSRRSRSGRGAVVVIVAIVLAVLLGFLGFVLNIGHAMSVRGELQNASDAAALAAARELDGTTEGIDAARRVARSFAALHATDTTQTVDISPAMDVQFCSWNAATRTLDWCLPRGTDPTSDAAPAPTPPGISQLQAANAVRVLDGREASRGNALPVWLSGTFALLGGEENTDPEEIPRESIDVRSSATAIGGGAQELCGLIPLAFANCDPDLIFHCGEPIVFRNDENDTAALTGLGGVANVPNERYCASNAIPVGGSRTCEDAGSCSADSSGRINIQNGNNFNPLVNAFSGLVSRPEAQKTFYAPVVRPDGCPSNPKFNQDWLVLGFMEVEIIYVAGAGPLPSEPPPPPEAEPCEGSGPCVIIRSKCEINPVNATPGGYNLGVPALTSQLVQ